MTASKLKKLYIDFFVEKGHKILPNASLVPENDPTALFINSGMHPLVPFLLGQKHPLGERLVGVQRCLRTQDIDEVGNEGHLTFFEMLGNWSLGDYWKKESIALSWEFLIEKLKLDPGKIFATCFAGDENSPKDLEAFEAWKKTGLDESHIFFLGKEHNWWSVGETGPCGPDSEIFFDTEIDSCGKNCKPGCSCGKYVEIWNNVFIEFNRLKDGSLEKLKQQNIDTGMGVARTTALLQGTPDVFKTEIFSSLIKELEKISNVSYKENLREMRIIADHARAAVFVIGDGILPSNIEAGYIVRRLIRRAITASRKLSVNNPFLSDLAKVVVDTNKKDYPHLIDKEKEILKALSSEEEKFAKALVVGERWLEKTILSLKLQKGDKFPAEKAFIAVSTFGLPIDCVREYISKKGFELVQADLEKQEEEHKKQSRKGLGKRFAGGMADDSEAVIKYHTATHLLHQALRDLLGDSVHQVGSNITSERLRFDFTYNEKLTDEEISKLEKIINEKIKADLPVIQEEMTLDKAKKTGALAFFVDKYDDKVKVYSVGDYSKEVCGGPHVQSTAEIGKIKVVKQKAVAQGRRRLYLKLVHGS